MAPDVVVVAPDETLQSAASIMIDIDAGCLPVGQNDRLIGMVTDRDLALRGLGKGLGPDATVREAMSDQIKYCFEDEDLEEVMETMGDLQIRRLPVLNREKRLVGIISLGDCAGMGSGPRAGEALADIVRPSALHSQLT
jgi:CBS domain-containing protein